MAHSLNLALDVEDAQLLPVLCLRYGVTREAVLGLAVALGLDVLRDGLSLPEFYPPFECSTLPQAPAIGVKGRSPFDSPSSSRPKAATPSP